MMRESDNDYRSRLIEVVPVGMVRIVEELLSATGEQLDAIGAQYECQRLGAGDSTEALIERAMGLDQALPADWKTQADSGSRWNIVAADGTDVCITQQQISSTRGVDTKRDLLTTGIIEMRNMIGALAADAKRFQTETKAVSAAWEAEYSQGGTEQESALTCMLLALKTIRDLKTGMKNGFDTLIKEREEARADAKQSMDENLRTRQSLHEVWDALKAERLGDQTFAEAAKSLIWERDQLTCERDQAVERTKEVERRWQSENRRADRLCAELLEANKRARNAESFAAMVENGESITHECPLKGSALTPCCDKTPFELPRTDRMTLIAGQVNCDRVRWKERAEKSEKLVTDLQVDIEQLKASVRITSADRKALFAVCERAGDTLGWQSGESVADAAVRIMDVYYKAASALGWKKGENLADAAKRVKEDLANMTAERDALASSILVK